MSDIRRKIGEPGLIKSLIRNNHGAIAVYLAIFMPVMIGIGAMSLDIGRLITLHTELQYAADAAALAAALELDRSAGSRDRARATAQGATANLQTFATDGLGKQVAVDVKECADPPVPPCIRFLKSLPNDDDEPITAKHVATADNEARFIQVHVGARSVTNALIQIVTLGSGPSTIDTVASSVAGYDSVICGVAPLFMCDPSPFGTSLDDLHGRQVRLDRPESQGGMFGPGNFGLLCPPDDPKCEADEIRDWLGKQDPEICIGLSGIPTKPGVSFGKVAGAINTRLDNWSAHVTADVEDTENGNWRNNPDFAPPRNVTQGGAPYKDGPKCLYSDLPSVTAMGLPRDAGFDPSHVGNGVWAWEEYFRINHSDVYTPGQPHPPSDWPASFGWPPTRYQTYRWESEMGVTANKHIVRPGQEIYNADGTLSGDVTAEDGESGNSPGGGKAAYRCAKPRPDGDPLYDAQTDKGKDQIIKNDRRIITIAVVDCSNAQQKINSRTYITPHAFVFGFLTETMDSEEEGMHFEIVKSFTPILETFGHRIVQIYRR